MEHLRSRQRSSLYAGKWQDTCWQQAAEVVVDDLGKEAGSKYRWKPFPRSSWPAHHQHDALFQQIKLYVYPLPSIYHRGVMRALVNLMHVEWPKHNASYCLLRRCACGAGNTRLQLRQITSEVPILLRLLQTTTLVDDPRHADGFLVPFPVASWQRHAAIRRRPSALWALLTNLSGHLVHLNRETAARHIFLASQDSCFNPVGLFVPHSERSLVLNLGPVRTTTSNPAGGACDTCATHTFDPCLLDRGTGTPLARERAGLSGMHGSTEPSLSRTEASFPTWKAGSSAPGMMLGRSFCSAR